MSLPSRTAILDGAVQAFGEHGYGSTRVEDILAAAGVSRATFYKSFSSKEEVFDAIEDSFQLSFVQAVGAVFNDQTLEPAERAAAAIDAYLRWLVGWRQLAQVMWHDPTRPRAGSVTETRQQAFDAFTQGMQGLATELGLPEVDELVYLGIVGAISEIGGWLVELPRVRDEHLERARAAIVVIVAGVLMQSTAAAAGADAES